MTVHRLATRARRSLGYVLCIGAAATGLASAVAAQQPALDALVRDVCGRQLLLLGEDANHGSGATLALKVELVKRLVTECHYSAVLFESQVYDFIDLEHAIAARTATPALVNDAIGGLWSKARETAAMAEFLHGQAMDGHVTLGGLDPQVGGATQLYTQQKLPAVLAGYLAGARAEACETEIARLTNYRYNDSVSYDGATRARLRSCVADIQASIAQRLAGPERARGRRDGDQPAPLSRDVGRRCLQRPRWRDVRESALVSGPTAEGSQGHRLVRDGARGQRRRSHLARTCRSALACTRRSAIARSRSAFPRSTGSFGRPGRAATSLDSAPPSSLEGRAMAGFSGDIRYVDRKELAGFGSVVGRALNYRKPESADWAELLDGLVVLREERPQHS